MRGYEKAILADGRFWRMQDLLRKRHGVVSTRVGYTGGDVADATEDNIGEHAEAIEIALDRNFRSEYGHRPAEAFAALMELAVRAGMTNLVFPAVRT